ncbi:Secreted protein OS=Streptomyces glaucescens OX=1907 GN=SGLAU_10195 PE=4 SV=1 [Streptomyces glaucescens]
MPGMATNAEMKKLGTLNGKQAEVFFLQLMTDHHKGGIHMAEGCVAKCTVSVEKRLAQGMVEGQESELRLMADLLKERGAKPRP